MKQSDTIENNSEKKEQNFIYNTKVIFIYSLCITLSLSFNSLMLSIFQSFSHKNKILAQIVYILCLFSIFIIVTNIFNIRIANLK